MKASDYIAERIKLEIDTVFGVTGGCVVNLVDSFHKKGLRIIPMHHEQSAAIAADAYARFKGFGVCFGTSGPGTTNLITGTCCSWFDGIPVLTIAGQVPTKNINDSGDRQKGFQEVDGVSLFKSITKYSEEVFHKDALIEYLEKAIQNAKISRKGPTFLSIPDDIQREEITPKKIKLKKYPKYPLTEEIIALKKFIKKSKRPVLILGAGVNHNGCYGNYWNNFKDWNMPTILTWGVKGIPFRCDAEMGITCSDGNELIKQADLILMVGTRMDTHQVPDFNKFAPHATKIAIGLEFPHEVDYSINCDLKYFPGFKINKNWKYKINKTVPQTKPYQIIEEINKYSKQRDIIIPDMGQTGCIAFQRWKPKYRQRIFNGLNHSPMGYSLPGAIGATFATGRRIIVIIGEGSLMFNLQDLQTISHYKLPIHIFVFENNGYGMIQQTQNDWKEFLEQGVAATKEFNLTFPTTKKIAEAFNIVYTNNIKEAMDLEVPSITSFKVNTKIIPKWKYGEKL